MYLVQKLLAKVYRQIGTPLAETALGYVSKGEWERVLDLPLQHPSAYASADAYYKDAVVCELTRKLRLPGDKRKRRMAAISNFWASETQCAVTNKRLARYIPDQQDLRDSADVAVDDFIGRWRKEVGRVLGRAPTMLEPRFSPGSTLSDSGKLITIPDKMSSRPTVYTTAMSLYRDHFLFTPFYESWPLPEVRRSNRFFTVPKDSLKDRGCCMEASVCVMLQLAVGAYMKVRHRKVYGVRLEHLPCRHRRLAQLASAGRRQLATIDLSNASDTICRNLVRLLLPQDWWLLLNSLRAPSTLIDGKTVYLEKFSSMGNGFTFELETILYRTLAATVCGRSSVSAFGDDLIVPSDKFRDVLAALRFFGFTPNEKKTFGEGPFRESCGGDFFDGKPVRAHYLKELPNEPQHWIALHNGLCRVSDNGIHLSAALNFCKDQVPANVKACKGPRWLGDVVFRDDEVQPTFRDYVTVVNGSKQHNSPTYFYRAYVPVIRTFSLGKYFSFRVATAAASLGVKSELATRGSVSGYKTTWVTAWGVEGTGGWCG